MTLTNHGKFKEKPISYFKNDRTWWNFYLSTQKSQKFPKWIDYFCVKYIAFDLKKHRRVFIKMKTRVKFKEKPTYALENDMNILANFSPEHLKVSKL